MIDHSKAKFTDWMRRLVCYNQKQLTEYVFCSYKLHSSMQANLPLGERKSNPRLLKVNFVKLEQHLQDKFKGIFVDNYKFLKEYFDDRNQVYPRISIKVIINNTIVTLNREPHTYKDFKSRSHENSAFDSLTKGQDYYICNNIPRQIRVGKYINNRINIEKARKYKPSNDSDDHKVWIDCWHDVLNDEGKKVRPPSESCYKSTLVFPMSMNTSNLSQELKEYLRIGNQANNYVGRIVFGFLCLDHPSKDFFDEEIDINIGMIFSDLLCLYLIDQVMFTEYSNSYFQAKLSLEF